jgi:hypothetical protein
MGQADYGLSRGTQEYSSRIVIVGSGSFIAVPAHGAAVDRGRLDGGAGSGWRTRILRPGRTSGACENDK